MKLQEYIESKIDTEKYYHEYDGDSVSIRLDETIYFVSKNFSCTCKNCSLKPDSLCIRKLFALQSLSKKLVGLALLKKKESEQFEEENNN